MACKSIFSFVSGPMHQYRAGLVMIAAASIAAFASVAAAQVTMPVPPAVQPVAPPMPVRLRTTLPDEHEYQRTLRQYLGSLSEQDFDHGVTAKFTTPPVEFDREEQYRYVLLDRTSHPLIGTKRGMPAVNAPPKLFTLAEIETPQGVMRPPLWVEPTAFLVRWNYPGNPFYDSRAMKLRTFACLCVYLTMNDDLIEHLPEIGAGRTDSLGPPLIMLSHPYPAVREVLPEPVRVAYETGLRKMTRRLLDWVPTGDDPQSDLAAPLGLWYAGQALNDPSLNAEIEAYARRMYTNPRFFHPAGYFVDRGGIDLGFGGQSNFLSIWTALATGWPFAKEAVAKTHALRAYVCLPEPDGRLLGPSHFQSRYSADASRDQWEWGEFRNMAASMLTDEAAYLFKTPLATELAPGGARRARIFQAQINENGLNADRTGFMKNDEIKSSPWLFRPWQSYSFPNMVNFAFENYPRGAFAHREQLERDNSPMLKSPFLRDPSFVRTFDTAFTMTKQPNYAAIVHSGQVGGAVMDNGVVPYTGPYGFGGGQLSAFWTPTTGSVILGRRGGMTREKNYDPIEDWQRWPIHAVTGTKPNGKVFTTARNRDPEVTQTVSGSTAVVSVQGVIPRGMLGQPRVLEGRVHYARKFELAEDSLKLQTTVSSAGQDTIAELVETIPVFLRETGQQAKATPTAIEFQVGGKWQPAVDQWLEGVTAIRLTRFEGAAEITFDRARRVKLSSADWIDSYLSRASCRNVLIDLLENKDEPKVLRDAAVGYRIAPVKK